jgi:hypothetical protein
MKHNPHYADSVFEFLQRLEEELNHHELSVANLPETDEIREHHIAKTTELKLRIEQLTSFIAHHKIMRE